MKNILITGVNGFLGSNCAKYFSIKNKVYGIDQKKCKNKKNSESNLIESREGDVTIENLKKINIIPDIIIHCAGSGTVVKVHDEPYLEFCKAINSTVSVLEYARKYCSSAKIIYPSSPAVIGNTMNKKIKEDSIRKPISSYGYHKKIAEILFEDYCNNHNITSVIIRFFSLYGEGLKKQLLWDASNKLFKNTNEAHFFGTGNEIRDWIHIKDAVSLIDRVINYNGEKLEVFNGGSGKGKKVYEIIHLVKKYLNSPAKIVFNDSNRIGDPRHFLADTSRINKLKWEPTIDIKEGIKQYCNWYKRQHID